jgi:hypothetical protein
MISFSTREGFGRLDNRNEAQMTESTRFQQLLALANDGEENAIADLFKEFGYQYPSQCAKVTS